MRSGNLRDLFLKDWLRRYTKRLDIEPEMRSEGKCTEKAFDSCFTMKVDVVVKVDTRSGSPCATNEGASE